MPYYKVAKPERFSPYDIMGMAMPITSSVPQHLVDALAPHEKTFYDSITKELGTTDIAKMLTQDRVRNATATKQYNRLGEVIRELRKSPWYPFSEETLNNFLQKLGLLE